MFFLFAQHSVFLYRHTKEGEVIPLCQSPLDVQTETCNASDNFVFLVWPVTVVHKIDSSSPLWDISAEQLLTERFEIVVILEGKTAPFSVRSLVFHVILGSLIHCN